MRIWILMLGFNGLNIGAFTRHPSKSPVFLKSIRHREPSISQIWCSRRLSKNPAPHNFTFLCFSFLFSEEKFNKIDDEFTKCNTFLVSCLGNIVKRGAFPHCKSFLWRVKNFSSTNLSPSSLDMLDSLQKECSFPIFAFFLDWRKAHGDRHLTSAVSHLLSPHFSSSSLFNGNARKRRGPL